MQAHQCPSHCSGIRTSLWEGVHPQTSTHEVSILFSPPVLLRRKRREWGSVMVEWCGGYLAGIKPFWNQWFPDHFFWPLYEHWEVGLWQTTEVGYYLYETQSAWPCFSVAQQTVPLTHTMYRHVCLWIHRWQKQGVSSKAEPLPSCSPCCPSITYSTKGSARESCKGRELFIAQLQLPLGPENSCVHPLLSKGMERRSLLWCFGFWACLIYPMFYSTTTDGPASL